jgi:hypothetical protein
MLSQRALHGIGDDGVDICCFDSNFSFKLNVSDNFLLMISLSMVLCLDGISRASLNEIINESKPYN